MKTNKIILVLVSCIVLLTVFSVNCFAFFPGFFTSGKALYNSSTMVYPKGLSFTNIQGSLYGDGDNLEIPFSDYAGYGACFVEASSSFGGIEFSVMGEETIGSTVYMCNIGYVNSTMRLDCQSIDLLYRDCDVSFNSRDTLNGYLDNIHSFFPGYLAVSGIGSSTATLSCSAKILNGEEVISSNSFFIRASQSNGLYQALLEPFVAQLKSFVNSSPEPQFYNTLRLQDIKISVSGSDTGNFENIRLNVYYPTLDKLPEGLTFNSISSYEFETIVKYDLNPLQFLFDTFSGFFAAEIYMGITLGHLLIVAIAVPALAAVLKAFGGK